MQREWSPEQLIDCWTLLEEDRTLLRNKSGASRLGFAVLLKFFDLEARFPRHVGEVPTAAVEYVAGQVKVDSALFGKYGLRQALLARWFSRVSGGWTVAWSWSRRIRRTVAGDGCWPFFLPWEMTSRAAMSRRLRPCWSRRCRAWDSIEDAPWGI